MRIRFLVSAAIVFVMVSCVFGALVSNASANQSARDSYGYRWTDSNAGAPAVAFNWVEIDASGTDTGLTGSLVEGGPYSIGFNFNFYGYTYTHFYVTTNGFIGFDGGYEYEWSNDQIPESWGPDNFIAPYWTYGTNYDGTIYYQTMGVSPNQQLVVEWENVSTIWTSDLLTFEVILNETGEIWFQYLEVGTDYGSDASVGIEDLNGNVGVEYSYDTSSLSNGLAILFSTGGVMIAPSQTGVGRMGTDVNYTLTVKNWQTVSDSFEITYNSSLGWTVSLYDSMANPLADTDGDTVPDTGTIAGGASASIEVRISIPASPSAFQDITNVTATSYMNSATHDTCYLTTNVASAWFTPPHEDVGLDPNGIGEFEILYVNASVNVRVAGWYYIEGQLHTASESYFSYDAGSAYLAAGSGIVSLRFYGYQIREYGVDGPYHAHMTLYDGWDIEQDTDIHYTAAYAATEFMLPPGQFGTTHADGVVDTDADGLFDTLFINATVVANYDWSFRVYANLYDSSYNYMMYAQNYTDLLAGTSSVSLEFDAWDVYELGQDGFFYADLYLYAYVDGSWIYFESDSHMTGDYTLSQFERKPILFSTPINDYANDTNSDGYYNFLEVSATVDVAIEGDYTLIGILQADTWRPVIETITINAHLTAGLHTIDFYFTGWMINANGDSDDMDITLEAWSESFLVDSETYLTDYYYYDDFERKPILFSTPINDYANDTNSDGYYNFLEISATVDVAVEGDYSFVGILQADTWQPVIDTTTVDAHLTVGLHTIDFYFPGWRIRANGDNDDMDVTLEAWSGTVQVDSVLYTTYDYYYYYDFEQKPIFFSTPIDDYANDTDSDGEYNFLEISATVDVAVEDDYSFVGTLRADAWQPVIDTTTVSAHLTVGLHTIDFYFPGWPISENGDSNSMDITLEAWSGPVLIDSVLYTTAYYYHYDFESAPGWFQPPYNDYGLDTNSDSLFDYLVVEVPVTVDTAGSYEVRATLNAGVDVETLSTTTYLDVGTTTVEVRFTGWLIWNNSYDGTFYVYLYLYDSGNRQMASDLHTTSYLHSQFQGNPASFGSPHEAYVEDADSDGDYDGIFVNVTVIVDSGGTFLVQGVLIDSGSNQVTSAGSWATLGTGTHVVQIVLPAWMINLNGVDGPFIVDLTLHDANRNVLDIDSVTTSTYSNESFDSTIPQINSEWAPTAPTIDGAISAGEWADATVVDLAAVSPLNTIDGSLLVMNDATNLYIAYDAYGDTHEDSDDASAIGFDTGNDEVATNGHEDSFLLIGSSPGESQHLRYSSSFSSWISHCSPFDTALAEHDTLAGNIGFGPSDGHAVDHRIYEYSIPLALLDLAPGDAVGFLGRSWSQYGLYDAYDGTDSSWPTWFPYSPSMSQYGDLLLAPEPIVIPPPVTTATASGTSGSSGWYLSQVDVTLTATGGSGGLDYTQYRLDGGSWTAYSAKIPVTGDGTHSLEFRSVDNAAQVEATKILTVKIDTTAPTSAASVSGSWFWLNGTDASSGVSLIKYRIDGGAWTTYTGKVNITTSGTHEVQYYAVDKAGNNESAKSVTVKVGKSGSSLGISSGTLMLIGLLAAAVVAALVVLVLLMKRRKGNAPSTYAPVQYGMPPPPPSQ